MLSRLTKKSAFAGIDLEGDSAKLIGLTKIKNNFRIAACAVGTAQNIVAALQKTINAAQIKIKTAAIAIPYSAVIIKTISLDASLQEHEILHYLNVNMEKYTGALAQNINMDFDVLGKTQNDSN